MKSQNANSYEPLWQALQNVQFWLTRNGASRLIAARLDFAAMQGCDLPHNVRISARKLRGPRLARRGARTSNPGRTTIANWPEDGVSEYAMPMLCFVMSGPADLRIGDYILHCQASDMIYMPAGIPKCNSTLPHLEGARAGRSCDLLWLHPYIHPSALKCSICRSVESQHLVMGRGSHGFTESPFMQQVYAAICEEIERAGKADTIARMMSLLVHLFQCGIKADEVVPSPDLLLPTPDIERPTNAIAQMCAYIDSHLGARLTIEDMAKRAFLSPSLFTRYFRTYTGQSFKAYLTKQRLEKATRLLTESDYTVASVGEQVGLKTSQLRALFQQHHGCSPMDYRRNTQLPAKQAPKKQPVSGDYR